MLLALVVAVLMPASPRGDVRLPSSVAPRTLVAASDGSLWMTLGSGGIARLGPDGRLRQYELSGVSEIAEGPDGAIWFTDLDGVGRIDRGGAVRTWPVRGIPNAFMFLDGASWLTDVEGGIYRVTAKGPGARLPVPGSPLVGNGAAGPDGALWFLEAGAVGRMTPDGRYAKFPSRGATPDDSIAAGPDGALWFTEQDAHAIGRVTTAGAVTEFPAPEGLSPSDITSADGAIWFSADRCLGRVTAAGEVATWSVHGARGLLGIAPAPGGGLWLADNLAHTIRHIEPGAPTGCTPPTVSRTAGEVQAKLRYRRLDTSKHGVDFFADARVQITRAGRERFAEVVPPSGRKIDDSDGGVFGETNDFRVRDLDGDGEPEVTLELNNQRNHCCAWLRVYGYDAARHTYRPVTHFWGHHSSAPSVRDLDGDGRPEFVSTDDQFTYDHDGFAGAASPIQIWSYRRGRFADVTRRHPQAIRRNAAQIWRLYVKYRGTASVRTVLPGWAADQYLLGRGATAQRALEQARRRGDLRCLAGCFDGPHTSTGYLRTLDRQLRNAGYIR
jgi:virginiamycin B lyase